MEKYSPETALAFIEHSDGSCDTRDGRDSGGSRKYSTGCRREETTEPLHTRTHTHTHAYSFCTHACRHTHTRSAYLENFAAFDFSTLSSWRCEYRTVRASNDNGTRNSRYYVYEIEEQNENLYLSSCWMKKKKKRIIETRRPTCTGAPQKHFDTLRGTSHCCYYL